MSNKKKKNAGEAIRKAAASAKASAVSTSGNSVARVPNGNTANAEFIPHSKRRAFGAHEYKGVAGKIQYGASHVGFTGDTVGSGEDFAEEYKRWKRGEFPIRKTYKL